MVTQALSPIRATGNYSVAMVRDDAAKTTAYEALFAPDSFGFEQFEIGQQFGFGVCVNGGDKDTPGQKGWSGWGPHDCVRQDRPGCRVGDADRLGSY